MDAIASYFKFRERGTDLATEARAGLTTFMVMAYIIFLNGNIIAKPLGLDPVAAAAGTALIAGIPVYGVPANFNITGAAPLAGLGSAGTITINGVPLTPTTPLSSLRGSLVTVQGPGAVKIGP